MFAMTFGDQAEAIAHPVVTVASGRHGKLTVTEGAYPEAIVIAPSIPAIFWVQPLWDTSISLYETWSLPLWPKRAVLRRS